ncbi:MAG: nitroreductase family protein [Actinomycetota bacterium]|nr:nitroreductase family protein [Actinomycetota bacterium]
MDVGEPDAGEPDAGEPDAAAALELLATTRAVRRYGDEAIDDGDLSRMLFAATRAPSGSNRQPFRFLVLRQDPVAVQARELLGGAARAMWAAKRERDGYDRGSGADPGSPKARTAVTMQHFVDHFEQIPVIVLAAAVRHRPPPEETLGASVYPACQNLLLAARALGYGGVMMMWHALVDAELRALFGIPDDVFLAATITLGRPVGGVGPVRRRPLQEFVYEGAWGTTPAWLEEPGDAAHTSVFRG